MKDQKPTSPPADLLMPDNERIVKTTCPRDCYDGCGIDVHLGSDQRIRIQGSKEHPIARGALCGKCMIAYNSSYLQPADRLLSPLRRVGPKGKGEFEQITWDTALGLVGERLHEVIRKWGAQSIVYSHYTGTCAEIASKFPGRLFDVLGATEIDPDTICNKAGHLALEYMFGTSCEGFDPRAIGDARCLFVWGCNPEHSAPRTYASFVEKCSADVVVVDPVRTRLAEKAKIHLRPFPGTDSTLAFSLLHCIWKRGGLDEQFIANHTTGIDEVMPTIASSSPEWAEKITGVSASLIGAAADLYLEGPSLLWLGQGLQRQRRGGNIIRSCVLLPVLTGNLGKPGSGFCYLNDTFTLAARNAGDMEAARIRNRPRSHRVISHMDLALTLEDPAASKVFFVWNANPLASSPRQGQLRESLARQDLFTVVVECFPTDTTDYADIVLPAATFLEFDDLIWNYFHMLLGAQVKVSEPQGFALPNQEIFRQLASSMGLTDPWLFETDSVLIQRMLDATNTGLTFDVLRKAGWAPLFQNPRQQFKDLRFNTPSGKIEISSRTAQSQGHPSCAQPTSDDRPPVGYFRLLSPAGKWTLNSSFGGDSAILGRMGDRAVIIHPQDAAHHGVETGQQVYLRNDTGRLLVAVQISDVVPPQVLWLAKGGWPKSSRVRANANLLNPGSKTDMGESSAVHGTLVQIERQ